MVHFPQSSYSSIQSGKKTALDWIVEGWCFGPVQRSSQASPQEKPVSALISGRTFFRLPNSTLGYWEKLFVLVDWPFYSLLYISAEVGTIANVC